MKKLSKILSLVLCVAMMLALLAGCGGKKLSGKYSAEVLESGITYSFDGSKVTVTLKALGNIVHSVEGEYEIEEDQITFTFPSDEKDAEDYTGTKTFEEGEDFIKIGGIKYTKK